MSNWLTPQQIPRPESPSYPTVADFMLAYAVWADVVNAGSHFLAATPDPQYASPQAYLQNMIDFAQTLTQNKFATPYAPSTWNPMAAAMTAVFNGFAQLSQMAVNYGDPNTVSVYQAWVQHTGYLFGGHVPIPANTGDGVNAATGQSAAPPGSIL